MRFFFSFMAYTLSYTLVLVKNAKSLFQATALLLHKKTHTHTYVHTLNSSKLMTVTENEGALPSALRST